MPHIILRFRRFSQRICCKVYSAGVIMTKQISGGKDVVQINKFVSVGSI